MSSQSVSATDSLWGLSSLKARPFAYFGRTLLIVLRILFGLFFLLAAINKFRKDWLFSDILEKIFLQRLTELNPDAFASLYLEYFALPLYPAVAWMVVWGELFAGIGLLLGLWSRWSALLALFILLNLAIGGYYDASLIPFFIIAGLLIYYPTGHWFGVDRFLASGMRRK